MAFILSDVQNQIVYDMSQGLMEKLAVEAMEVAMVSLLSLSQCNLV